MLKKRAKQLVTWLVMLSMLLSNGSLTTVVRAEDIPDGSSSVTESDDSNIYIADDVIVDDGAIVVMDTEPQDVTATDAPADEPEDTTGSTEDENTADAQPADVSDSEEPATAEDGEAAEPEGATDGEPATGNDDTQDETPADPSTEDSTPAADGESESSTEEEPQAELTLQGMIDEIAKQKGEKVGTITLQKDYAENISVPDEVDVTIDLNGHTISPVRESGVTTTLVNVAVHGKMTLKDGSADKSGKIINKIEDKDTRGVSVTNGATLTIEGGTIEGYQIKDGNGAGINVSPQGTLNMTGGSVKNNTASNFGGGLFAYNPKSITLDGGEFKGNEAVRGGGIAFNTVPAGVLSMGAVTLTENHASTSGGGLAFVAGTTNVEFDGTTITKNTATYDGGGIDVNVASTLSFYNVTINENKSSHYGGGIHSVQGSNITLNSGTVNNNEARNNGGGIAIITGTNRDTDVASTFVMDGGEINGNNMTNFAENNGGADGGGFYGARKTRFTMNGGKVNGNTNASNGGGIYLYQYCTATINDGEICNNSLQLISGDPAGYGGGFYQYNAGSTTIKNVLISGNTCKGGSVWGTGLYTYSPINMTGGEVTNQTSWAMWLVGGGTIAGNTWIHDNSNGVALQSNVTIGGEAIIENHNHSGTGIGQYNERTVTINAGTIRGFARGVNVSNVTMNGGEIYDNQVSGSGAAIYASRNVTINGGSIHDNTATGDGGAIWFGTYANQSLTIRAAEIYNNTSGGNGGVATMYSYNSLRYGTRRVYIYEGANIHDNTALNGGAFFLQEHSTLTMSGGTIESNKATKAGGAIYAVARSTEINVTGGYLCDNRANAIGNDVYVNNAYTRITYTDNNVEYTDKRPVLKLASGKTMEPTGTWYDEVEKTKLDEKDAVDNTELNEELKAADLESASNRKTVTHAYTFVKNSTDPVAQVDDILYTSIQDAIDAVQAKFAAAEEGLAEGEEPDYSGIDTNILLIKDTTESIVIPSGLTVSLDLQGHTVKGFSGAVILVEENADFTLKDNSPDKTGLITEGGGYLLPSNSLRYGGGAMVFGKFTMEAGTISGNTPRYGGGVSLRGNATFIMNGGEISNNRASDGAKNDSGGALCIEGTSTFIMNGGVIKDNIGSNAIYVSSTRPAADGGAFVLNDGEISSHTVDAFYVNADASVITIHGGEIKNNFRGLNVNKGRIDMDGGKITENKATGNGGGISLSNGSTLNLSGGEISKNEAPNGAGVFVANGTINMSGGVITENIASDNGGGVHFNIVGNNRNFNFTKGQIYDNTAIGGQANDIYLVSGTRLVALQKAEEMGLEYNCWYDGQGNVDVINTDEIKTSNTVGTSRVYWLTAAKARDHSDDGIVRIGETKYPSIQSAVYAIRDAEVAKAAIEAENAAKIAAAGEDEEPELTEVPEVDHTIYLLQDVTESFSIITATEVVLDLNGYGLFTNQMNGIRLSAAANLTLQNMQDQTDTGNSENAGIIQPIEGMKASRGVYLTDLNTTLRMKDGITLQNYSNEQHGGAINGSNGARLYIEGGVIRNCHALNGGAIYFSHASNKNTSITEFHMSGGLIDSCTATSNAGGIYYTTNGNNDARTADVFEMTGGTVQNCFAPYFGGIYVVTRDTGSSCPEKVIIDNVLIQNNKATYSGGGMFLFVAGSGETVQISNTVIDSNTVTSSRQSSWGWVPAYWSDGGIGIMNYRRNRPVLTNVTITNNKSAGSAAGIGVYGSVNIIGGRIAGNRTTYSTSRVGAIFIDGNDRNAAVSNITDTVIEDNFSANYINNNQGNVYFYRGTYNLKNVTIQNNKATYNSGVESNNSTVNFDGCTIANNTSGNYSSAINSYNSSTITLDGGTVVSGNGSTQAIYISSGSFYIKNAELKENRGRVVYMDGGTLYVQDGANIHDNTNGAISMYSSCTFYMEGGRIANNTAANGAALYMNSNIDQNPNTNRYNIPSFVMTGGEISGNKATTYGGAIFVANNGTTNNSSNYGFIGNAELMTKKGFARNTRFVVSGGVITGNSAGTYGGAICMFLNGNLFRLESGGKIYGNSAGFGQDLYSSYSSNYVGSSVWNQNEYRLIKAADMFKDTEGIRGIGWYDEDKDQIITDPIKGKQIRLWALTLNYTTDEVVAVINDDVYTQVQDAVQAVANGKYTDLEGTPEIRLVKNATENVSIPAGVDVQLNLNGYRLQGTNTALSVRGNITIVDEKATVTPEEDGVTYEPGEATGSIGGNGVEVGGGIRVYSGGYAKLVSGEITNSRAGEKGNSSSYGGAGVAVDSGTFEMAGGAIRNNTAKYGAAVLVRTAASKFIMTGGTISENTARTLGVIYNVSGKVEITGGTIEDNTAPSGVIYNQNSGARITIAGTSEDEPVIIQNNKATGTTFNATGGVDDTRRQGGGAINMRAGRVTLSNVSFLENTANYGGAIFVEGGTLGINKGVVMDGNTATVYGGAIYEQSGTVNMLGGVIANNRAQRGGGVAQNPSVQSFFNLMGGGVYNNVSTQTSAGNDFYSKFTGTGIYPPTSGNSYPKLTVIPALEMGNVKYNVWKDDTYQGTSRTGATILQGEYITGRIVKSNNIELTADYYNTEVTTDLSGDFKVTKLLLGQYDDKQGKVREELGITDGTQAWDASASKEITAKQKLEAGEATEAEETYLYNGVEYKYINYNGKLYEQEQVVEWAAGEDSGSINSVIRSYDTLVYKLAAEIGPVNPPSEEVNDDDKEAHTVHAWLEVELPAAEEEAAFVVESQDFDGYSISQRTVDGKTVQVLRGYKEMKGLVDTGRMDYNVKIQLYGMLNGQTMKPVFRSWIQSNAEQEENPIAVESKTITVSASGKYNITLDNNAALAYTGYFNLLTGEEVSEADYLAHPAEEGGHVVSGTVLGYGITVQMYNDASKGIKGIEVPKDSLDFDLSLHGQAFLDGNPIEGTSLAPYIWAYKENDKTSVYGRALNGTARSYNMDWNDEDDVDKTTSYAYNAAPFNVGGGSNACFNGGNWTVTGTQTVGGQTENTIHVHINGYSFDDTSTPDSLPNNNSDGSQSTIFGVSQIKPFSAGYIQIIFPLTKEQKDLNVNGYLSLHMDAVINNAVIETKSGQQTVSTENGIEAMNIYYDDLDTTRSHAKNEMTYADNYRGFDTGLYVSVDDGGGTGDSIEKLNYFEKSDQGGISGSSGTGTTPLGSIIYIVGQINYNCMEFRTDDPSDLNHYIAPENYNPQIDNVAEYNYMTGANILQKFDAEAYTPIGGAAIVNQPSWTGSGSNTKFTNTFGNFIVKTDESAATWDDYQTRKFRLTVLYGAKKDGTNWAKPQISATSEFNDGGVTEMDSYREENLIYFTTLDDLYAYFKDNGINEDPKCVAILYEVRNAAIRKEHYLIAKARMQVTDDFAKTGATYATTNDARIWSTYRPEYKEAFRGVAGSLDKILYHGTWTEDVYTTSGDITVYGAGLEPNVGYFRSSVGWPIEQVSSIQVDPDNGYFTMNDPDGDESEYNFYDGNRNLYRKFETVDENAVDEEGNKERQPVVVMRRISGYATDQYNNAYKKTQYENGSPVAGTHNGWRKGNTLLVYTLNSSISIIISDVAKDSNDRKNTYNVGLGERTVNYTVTPRLQVASSQTINPLVENGSQAANAHITLKLNKGLTYIDKSLKFDYSGSNYADGDLEWNISDVVTNEDGSSYIVLTTKVADISKALPTITYAASIGDVSNPENDVVQGASLTATAEIYANYEEMNNIAADMHSASTTLLIINTRTDGIYQDAEKTVVDVSNDIVFRSNYMRKDEGKTPFEVVNVLPYNGDTRGTKFTGGYRVTGASVVFNTKDSFDAYMAEHPTLSVLKDKKVGAEESLRTTFEENSDTDIITLPIKTSGQREDGSYYVEFDTTAIQSLITGSNASSALAFYGKIEMGGSPNKTAHLDITITPLKETADAAGDMIVVDNGAQKGGNIYYDNFLFHDVQGSLTATPGQVRVVNRVISGYVFMDLDQDGYFVPGSNSKPSPDRAMKNVDVYLYRKVETSDTSGTRRNAPAANAGPLTGYVKAVDTIGTEVPKQTTDDKGHYAFDNLPEGTYIVVFADDNEDYTYNTLTTGKGTNMQPLKFSQLSVTYQPGEDESRVNANTANAVWNGTDTATSLASLDYAIQNSEIAEITLPAAREIKSGEFNSANNNAGFYFIYARVQKEWFLMRFMVPQGTEIELDLKGQTAVGAGTDSYALNTAYKFKKTGLADNNVQVPDPNDATKNLTVTTTKQTSTINSAYSDYTWSIIVPLQAEGSEGKVTYSIDEKEVPTGYDKEISSWLEETTGYTVYQVTNAERHADVTFVKAAEEDRDHGLNGAQFVLYRKNIVGQSTELLNEKSINGWTLVTDTAHKDGKFTSANVDEVAGVVTIPNLPAGEYRLVEVKAPTGRIIPTTTANQGTGNSAAQWNLTVAVDPDDEETYVATLTPGNINYTNIALQNTKQVTTFKKNSSDVWTVGNVKTPNPTGLRVKTNYLLYMMLIVSAFGVLVIASRRQYRKNQ